MPFIKINCGAIAPSLLDSELFGHEKGSFTGALNQKKGYFERAHNGTLLLDELGEMPLDVQVRLLRILQSGVYERIGGNRVLHADVRIIAATNKKVIELVKKGKFRKDLFYRLSVCSIVVPPLRARSEDLALLIKYLLPITLKKMKLNISLEVLPENIKDLEGYPWYGNIRELQNTIEASILNYLVNSNQQKFFWISPSFNNQENSLLSNNDEKKKKKKYYEFSSKYFDDTAVYDELFYKNISHKDGLYEEDRDSYNHLQKKRSLLPGESRHQVFEDACASKHNVTHFSVERQMKHLSFDESVHALLIDALKKSAGKVYGKDGAAKLLGLNPSTLWGKLNKYKIRPEEFQL